MVICLAFVLCILPALVACDHEVVQDDDTSAETTVENNEGTASATDPTVTPDKNPGNDAAETEPEESTPAEEGNGDEETKAEETEPEETKAEETQGEEPDAGDVEEVFEGTRIAKCDNIAKTMILVLHQLAEPDVSGNTKCSLVLYDTEGNVLNYVIFEFHGNGAGPNVLTLKNTVWDNTSLTAYIKNADNSTQSFVLDYTK